MVQWLRTLAGLAGFNSHPIPLQEILHSLPAIVSTTTHVVYIHTDTHIPKVELNKLKKKILGEAWDEYNQNKSDVDMRFSKN